MSVQSGASTTRPATPRRRRTSARACGRCFYVKYLGFVRWPFHGRFSHQDKWMVEITDAPPERLYRPDDSLLKWRGLAEDATEERAARLRGDGSEPVGPPAES